MALAKTTPALELEVGISSQELGDTRSPFYIMDDKRNLWHLEL